MKRLLMLLVVCWVAMPACAQFSPLQVTVQRLSKKKSAQGEVTPVGGGFLMFADNSLSSSLSLRITLQNTGRSPVDNIVVRWGIAKRQISGTGHAGDSAYGKEEKLSLKPKESKIIETETVEAARKESQLSDDASGEKIRGHGVQVMIGGKVVWEEFVPATVKKSFDNLKPLEDKEEPERREKPSKKNKKN